MSAYYAYVNLDRRERLGVGALDGSAKASSVGTGLTARALAWLLLDSPSRDEGTATGRWAGDRVVLVSDDSTSAPEGPLEDATLHALRALLEAGDQDLPRQLEWSDTLFEHLDRLATDHGVAAARDLLVGLFGSDWRAAREEKLATGAWTYAPRPR